MNRYCKMIHQFLIIGVFIITTKSYAQVNPPPIPPPPPPGLPIDGGVGFLIVGAIFYGIKNMKNSNKQPYAKKD